MIKLVLVFALLLIPVFKFASGYYRNAEIDGRLMRAWHITLPGYATVYYPEQTVELERLVGTYYNPFKAVDAESGEDNPEVTAGLALKIMDLYTDYEFVQDENGHWVLHRPERTESYFTLSAYYRVSSWKDAD